MNTPIIPQYKDRGKLSGTSIRLTQKQLEDLDRLKGATNSPSIGKTIDTIVTAELDAVHDGLRTKDDYIPQEERKHCTFSFKVSEEFKESASELQYFYDAPTISAVIAHTIDWYARVLESGKAVQ